jgi:hypothetical protein
MFNSYYEPKPNPYSNPESRSKPKPNLNLDSKSSLTQEILKKKQPISK